MQISMIVAQSNNRAIGRANALLWHLPADLKYFKQRTNGHCIVMGRKTFESIGRPLPNRTNIVLTHRTDWQSDGVQVAHTWADVLQFVQQLQENELFIIGGGEIYAALLPHCQTIYLTEVDTIVNDADTFFPALNPTEWECVEREAHAADEKNPLPYAFTTWKRI